MCIVFILLKAPVTAKVLVTIWNIWNVRRDSSFLSSDNKLYCVLTFVPPLNSSFWLTPGEDGGRKLSSGFGSGPDRESHPGTQSSYLVSGTMGFCPGVALKKVDNGEENDDWIHAGQTHWGHSWGWVLLCLHHQSVHGVKLAIPQQPRSALLAHERGSLKVQRQEAPPLAIRSELERGKWAHSEGLKGQSRQEETAGFVSRWAGVGAQTLPLTSCVTVGKLPFLPLLWNGNSYTDFTVWLRGWNIIMNSEQTSAD